MMQNNWRVGSLFGIPLYIDSSWLIILILVTVLNASEITAKGLTNTFPPLAFVVGLLMALLLFASVLLHELGHSLIAKSQGIGVKSITLFLFGGVASIDRESSSPGQAFQVAIAGPVVSFLLFALFAGIATQVSENGLVAFIAQDLSRINIFLAIFNLLPGLPLDGGQVLKALVWKITGDRFKGIQYAAISGKVVGGFFIALGFFFFLTSGDFGALWIALIGWFIFRNATSYEKLNTMQQILKNLTASDTMEPSYRTVDAHLTLREFADKYLLFHGEAINFPYYAVSEGRYRGLMRPKLLNAIERSEWEQLELINVVEALDKIDSVTEKTALVEVIALLEIVDDAFVTVLSPAGSVAGIIDRGCIVKAIASKYGWTVPTQELQRINSERSYPNGLPLVEMAKQIQNS